MKNFMGKKVFIVGGSEGIGRSIALQLARDGAAVVVAARREDPLKAVVEEMRGQGTPGQTFGFVSMDVTDRAQVQAGCDSALEQLGGMDLLCCISGYAETAPLDELEFEAMDRMMQVNYFGHVNVTKTLYPHFKKQGSGHIALASSMLGFMSMWGWSGYSASKFAIWGFAEALRQEMLLRDVGVSVHFFPSTQTPGFDRENEDKHPIIMKMETDNAFSKTYPSDEVANQFLRGVKKGKFENVVGWDSALIRTAMNHLPRVVRMMIDGDLRKAAKGKV